MHIAFMYVYLGYTASNMKHIYLYIYLIYIYIYLYKNSQSIYISQYLSDSRLSHNQSSHIQISQQIIILSGNHIVTILHITQQVYCTQFLKTIFHSCCSKVVLTGLQCYYQNTLIILPLLVTLFECTLMSQCI